MKDLKRWFLSCWGMGWDFRKLCRHFPWAPLIFVAVTHLPHPWEESLERLWSECSNSWCVCDMWPSAEFQLFSLSESLSAPLASVRSIHPLYSSLTSSHSSASSGTTDFYTSAPNCFSLIFPISASFNHSHYISIRLSFILSTQHQHPVIYSSNL